MTKTTNSSKKINLLESIKQTLRERDIEDVGKMCFTGGSTHVMKTCKIDNESYFLKFSDENLFDEGDPSLQILVEYLAYNIYSLYPGINIPKVELIFDKTNKKIGLASSSVKGQMVGDTRIDPKKLAKMLTAGVFVDVFLANWDVIGTGTGNVILSKDKAVRIDPGGSLTFRAQGGKKGKAFGKKPSELDTMLKPGMGSGDVFQYADLKEAGKAFLSTSWDTIFKKMVIVNNNDIVPNLKRLGMTELLGEWKKEILHIASTLKKRHEEVSKHIDFILS